ncbi:hypothetical protein RhiXN_06834 [Rhizoctonia solani]|uniref:Uncharacterized protein n=1 Tax=Rhizoctonia solani TaxID=456999 RepID=A0A8H8NYP3_9AGAM|nr:uncharacterized protein RhiXN_06834 [Rhizoctonia solani]QRW21845.1 hypothetical protein RhiXN_06834 [Rhizoctonia solani]
MHGTVTLNNNPARLEAELKESIVDKFNIAKNMLEGLEDTIPAFDKNFEPVEQPAKEGKHGKENKGSKNGKDKDSKNGANGKDSKDDHVGRDRPLPARFQGKNTEEYGPGKVPDGTEILKVIYQPPTTKPTTEACNSPIWDLEEDEQPPAKPLKMVLLTKSHPPLSRHIVLSSSTACTSAGPPMPIKAPKPTVPAPPPFLLSKTSSIVLVKSGLASVIATEVKLEGSVVASGSKTGMSIRVAQSPTIKKPRLDSPNDKAQLEYVVPKHSVGSKVVTTKGTKHVSNPTKANGSPTKKRSNGKECKEVVETSSDDEHIGKLVGKKEASNTATIVVMDSKCKIHVV